MENYREYLNEIDMKCIDENLHFYDLRSLYESTVPNLSPEDKQELKKVLDSTNDPEIIAAALTAKATKDKNESLEEDEQLVDKKVWYDVFIESPGGVKHDLTEFDTEVEAEDFCNQHDWHWVDENGFDWQLDYEEKSRDWEDWEKDESLNEDIEVYDDVSIGGDKDNYILLYAGVHLGGVSEEDAINIGKQYGMTHILWGSEYGYKGMYNGDMWLLYKDANKLPKGYKEDALKYGKEINESLNEDKVIYSLRELRDWIKDHKQATKDIERYYGKPVDNLFKDEIFDWLFDHEELFNDFKKYFGVNESLKEEYSYNPDDEYQELFYKKLIVIDDDSPGGSAVPIYGYEFKVFTDNIMDDLYEFSSKDNSDEASSYYASLSDLDWREKDVKIDEYLKANFNRLFEKYEEQLLDKYEYYALEQANEDYNNGLIESLNEDALETEHNGWEFEKWSGDTDFWEPDMYVKDVHGDGSIIFIIYPPQRDPSGEYYDSWAVDIEDHESPEKDTQEFGFKSFEEAENWINSNYNFDESLSTGNYKRDKACRELDNYLNHYNFSSAEEAVNWLKENGEFDEWEDRIQSDLEAYLEDRYEDFDESLNEEKMTAYGHTEKDINRLKYRLREIEKDIENGADPDRFVYEKNRIQNELIELGCNDGWYDESLNEDSLAKPFKKEFKNAYKSFDRKRDFIRKKNADIDSKIPNDLDVDDADLMKDILHDKEPKWDSYRNNVVNRMQGLEKNEYPFYVTYYVESPHYHPEEGGYYVASVAAVSSEGYNTKQEARQAAAELADELGFEKLSPDSYRLYSKYIGDSEYIYVESANDYLGKEKGDQAYESLHEAKFGPYNYRYEVHWISPEGKDILLGANNDFEAVENIAINQIETLLENPWESNENKYKIIDSLYIYDSEKDDADVMGISLEDYIDGILSELDSRIRSNSLDEDTIKQNGKWVNKGKEGTHGTFKTKKEADAQRKAMFAQGYKESLSNTDPDKYDELVNKVFNNIKSILHDENYKKDLSQEDLEYLGKLISKKYFTEGLQDIQNDFANARKNWDSLGFNISFDDALEKYNDKYGEERFYAKPIYDEDAWNQMVNMFSSKNESVQKRKLTFGEFCDINDPECNLSEDELQQLFDRDSSEYSEDEIDSMYKQLYGESLNEAYDDEEYDSEFEKGRDGCFYKQIAHKMVYDSDGFTTDYTLYMKAEPADDGFEVSYVTVFGDNELYRPDDGGYDYETDDLDNAFEWFESYNGFEDELDESWTLEDSERLVDENGYVDINNITDYVWAKYDGDLDDLRGCANSIINTKVYQDDGKVSTDIIREFAGAHNLEDRGFDESLQRGDK